MLSSYLIDEAELGKEVGGRLVDVCVTEAAKSVQGVGAMGNTKILREMPQVEISGICFD